MTDSTPARVSASTSAFPAARRWLAFSGALLAAAAVALSAYAAHATTATTGQGGLQAAAAIAFGHGLALAALARLPQRRLALFALLALLLGALLFSGGVFIAHTTGLHARSAPVGGTLLILAWLVYAIDTLRG